MEEKLFRISQDVMLCLVFVINPFLRLQRHASFTDRKSEFLYPQQNNAEQYLRVHFGTLQSVGLHRPNLWV